MKHNISLVVCIEEDSVLFYFDVSFVHSLKHVFFKLISLHDVADNAEIHMCGICVHTEVHVEANIGSLPQWLSTLYCF